MQPGGTQNLNLGLVTCANSLNSSVGLITVILGSQCLLPDNRLMLENAREAPVNTAITLAFYNTNSYI